MKTSNKQKLFLLVSEAADFQDNREKHIIMKFNIYITDH